MKLPNDLIKSTDYDKAKDRIIHEFECVNGKVVQHYVLGGEHELTTQEIIDCLNAFATIDCDLQTAYAYIKGQEDKISDLEAKLAESENKVKEYATEITRRNTEQLDMQTRSFLKIRDLDTEILKLKQQLAEKDKEIETYKKQFNEQAGLCEEFRFQLAEKDNEIEKLTEELDDKNFCKDFVDLYTENKLKTQMLHENWKDKISFAVEQLKLLRNEIEMMGHIPNYTVLPERELICRFDVFRFIDNQIEELKKEMK